MEGARVAIETRMRARGGKFQSSSSTISTNSETLLYRGTHFVNGTIQGKTLFVVISVVLPVCFPVELDSEQANGYN